MAAVSSGTSAAGAGGGQSVMSNSFGGGAGRPMAQQVGNRQAEYSRLLQQLASIQTQLQGNMHAVHVLKSENASLRESNEQLKVDLKRQRDKADDIRRQWHHEAKGKLAVEQKYEELMAGWNAQLEAKAEEFEELRSQLAPPRDLDVLRVKIREELEVEYQEKLQSLQAQTAKYQDMFFNIRREHELLKTEFNQFTIDHGQEAASVQETHKATVMELKRQIQDLQALVDDPTAGDTIRNLTLRVDQARHREVSLQKEAEDLRQAKEDAVVMHKEAVLAHSREAGVVEAKMSALNLDRSSLQRQIEAAEVTQQKLNQKLAEANGRVESLEKTVARLNRQLSTQERHVAGADAMAQQKYGQASTAWETERSTLIAKLDAQEEANDKLQTRVRQLQEELKSTELRRNESVRKATSQMQAKLAEAEDKHRQLVAQVAQEEAQKSTAQMEHREQIQRLEARIEALQQDKRKAEQDKVAAETKMRQAADETANVKNELLEQRSGFDDLEEEYKNLQNKHREHLAREHALAVKTQRLEMTVQHLEGEVEMLQGESDKQRVAHEAAIQEQLMLRQKLASAEQSSHDALQHKLKAARHDLTKLANKHKKRADEYKRRLLDTYGRYRRASDSLKAFKSERSATIQALEDKLSAAQRRVKELEREREMWIRGGSFALGGNNPLVVGALSTTTSRPSATSTRVGVGTGTGVGAGAGTQAGPTA